MKIEKDVVTLQFDVGEKLEEFILESRIGKDAITILFDTGENLEHLL